MSVYVGILGVVQRRPPVGYTNPKESQVDKQALQRYSTRHYHMLNIIEKQEKRGLKISGKFLGTKNVSEEK